MARVPETFSRSESTPRNLPKPSTSVQFTGFPPTQRERSRPSKCSGSPPGCHSRSLVTTLRRAPLATAYFHPNHGAINFAIVHIRHGHLGLVELEFCDEIVDVFDEIVSVLCENFGLLELLFDEHFVVFVLVVDGCQLLLGVLEQVGRCSVFALVSLHMRSLRLRC